MDTIFGVPAVLLGSVARHALTSGAGALAAAGYLTNDEASMVVSVGMGIAGIGAPQRRMRRSHRNDMGMPPQHRLRTKSKTSCRNLSFVLTACSRASPLRQHLSLRS
jgi:hypothetical protein